MGCSATSLDCRGVRESKLPTRLRGLHLHSGHSVQYQNLNTRWYIVFRWIDLSVDCDDIQSDG